MTDCEPLAPCGIDCSECEIRRAALDPEFAEILAAQWRETWQPEARADWFKCEGCRGDRSVCWTEDCPIYACCVEQRGLAYCSDCDGFPCDRIVKWGVQYPNHARALERLNERRERRG